MYETKYRELIIQESFREAVKLHRFERVFGSAYIYIYISSVERVLLVPGFLHIVQLPRKAKGKVILIESAS